jgi:prefoldin subunit 5
MEATAKQLRKRVDELAASIHETTRGIDEALQNAEAGDANAALLWNSDIWRLFWRLTRLNRELTQLTEALDRLDECA